MSRNDCIPTRPASSEKVLWLAELTRFPDVEPVQIRPNSLTMDITHTCNFRCRGCIEESARCHSRRTSLLEDTACQIITQFAAQGGKEVLLYGGEPTLHSAFSTILCHAASCVERIRIVTNGSRLTISQIAEELGAAAKKRAVSVRVSVNAGTSETHELLHGVKGFFPRVVEGMKALSDNRVPLDVGYLLEEANANEIHQAYDIATEVGAKNFYIRPKTGIHGIGLVPLSMGIRTTVLRTLGKLVSSRRSPVLRVSHFYYAIDNAQKINHGKRSIMKTVAYLRVSKDSQDVKNQRLAILEFARREKMEVDDFVEITVSSRKSTKERKVDQLLEQLDTEDTLIVCELSRMGRSVGEIITTVATLVKKKIRFIAVKEGLRLNGSQDMQTKVMVTMFGLFAEIERDLISMRTKEGLAAAKASGKKLGRPKGVLGKSKLDGREDEIKRFLALGVSKASIAKITGVDRSTLYNSSNRESLL